MYYPTIYYTRVGVLYQYTVKLKMHDYITKQQKVVALQMSILKGV